MSEPIPSPAPYEAFRDALLAAAEPEAAGALRERLEAALGRQGERLFEHVSAEARPNPVFEAAFAEAWGKTRGTAALHLELGTWIAWPEERARDYVAVEAIGDVVRLDFNAEYRPDVAASATALPFRDGSIDRVSSNSLLEHVLHADEVIEEAFRVLKPGGVLYTAVPFHFVEHKCPGDYLRFTGEYFEALCREIGFETVVTDTVSTSGVFYTTHNLAKGGLASPDLPNAAFVRTAHHEALKVLAALQAFDDEMVAEGRSLWHSTKVVAVKPGAWEAPARTPDRSRPFLERHPDLFLCPETWTPLTLKDERLVSADGTIAYPVTDGVPNMVVAHGRGSKAGLRAEVRRLRAELKALRDERA